MIEFSPRERVTVYRASGRTRPAAVVLDIGTHVVVAFLDAPGASDVENVPKAYVEHAPSAA